jgi:hypothetical protein
MHINPIGKFLLIVGGAFLATAAAASAQTADATTINNKVMAGYQGWFRTPGDVSGNTSWAHWFNGTPSQSEEAFDSWPDLTGMPSGAQDTVPGFKFPNGNAATLYSGQSATAVLTHFQWMQTAGIDGVWVSEFESHLPGGSSASDYPNVLNTLNNIRAAATSTGRTWAFFYDTSGQSTTTLASGIETQWENMVNTGYTSDPRYLHMNGLPVVMLFGFFPNDTNHNLGNPTVGQPLINFFKSGKYAAYVVGSGAWNWTTGNSAFQDMLFTLNAYIPWNVGHTMKASDGNIVSNDTTWATDYATFKSHNVKYIPLVNPGTCAAGPPLTNCAAPRRNGYYLWEQFVDASNVGVGDINSVFVAMYDEVNEGTAIMPITNTPPAQTPPFLTSPGDPGNWYEELVVSGEGYLKNSKAVPTSIPITP